MLSSHIIVSHIISNKSNYNDSVIAASERRILCTKWVGDAVDHVSQTVKIEKFFEKTGCLMTVSGVFDSSITI